jgi:sugar phosphate isomerase/epimerase
MKALNFLFVPTLLFLYSCGSQSSPDNWAIGTSSGLLSEYSQEELDQLRENGITHLELSSGVFMNKSQEERENWCNEFIMKANKAGVKVWSIHLPFSRTLDVSLIDSTGRINAIREFLDIITICKILNPTVYVIHPSAEPIEDSERPQRIENSIMSLKIINDEVKKQGAKLAVECLPRTCLGNTSSELLQTVNAVNDGIGICFDSNHLLKENPEDFIAKTGHLITTVHMSDYDGIDERHWLPGKGVINWNNVIHELVKSGYKGPFLFEVSSRNYPDLTAKSLYDCWAQLKENYKNGQ